MRQNLSVREDWLCGTRRVQDKGAYLTAQTPQPLYLPGERTSNGQWLRTQEAGVSEEAGSRGASRGRRSP